MTYRLIYADPPWRYRDKRRGRGGAEGHYPTCTMGEIAGHIMAHADPKCCTLACWQTWPMERAQDALLEGIGFKKIGLLFLWWKLTETGKDHFGGGLAGTRSNSEPCFLWRMGAPLKRSSGSERQDVEEVCRAHSQKPPEARRRLERMFPICDRIELYARGEVPGWAAWGNEAGRALRQEDTDAAT